MAAYGGDPFIQAQNNILPHSGNSFPGNVIDKPAAARRNRGNTFLWSRGGNEPNAAQARLFHQLLVFIRLLRRQIEREQAIHAGGGGGINELFQASAMHDIKVNVQNNRYI